jgi:hypothetical protein
VLTADYVDEEGGAQDRRGELDHAEDGGGEKFPLKRKGFSKHVSVELGYGKVEGRTHILALRAEEDEEVRSIDGDWLSS